MADPEGVRSNPFNAAHFFKISYENEIIWLHFHGIFDKIEIKSARRTPTLLYIRAPFPAWEILDPPLQLVPIFGQPEPKYSYIN